MLGSGGAYVGWWVATPGDCTALAPEARAWQPDGLHPELRSPCPLHPGDVLTGSTSSGPGTVTYSVLRGGSEIEVTVPQSRADLGSALRGGWSALAFTVPLAVLAGYAAVRRPREPASAALLLTAVCLLTSTAAAVLGLPASAAGTTWQAVFLGQVLGAFTLAWGANLAFALTFPTPLLRITSTARVLPLAMVPLAVVAAAAALLPGPVGSPGWTGRLIVVQSAVTVGWLLVALGVAVLRVRRGSPDPVARQQLRWVGAGGWTASSLVLAGWFVPSLLTGAPLLPAAWIGLPGLPLVGALAVAILRFRLFDLDVVATRTMVYAALTACVVTLYLAVVSALAAALQGSASSPAAVVGAAVVAIAVNPLRLGLQRAVDRFMYGDRDEPYAAVSRLGQRLSAAASADDVLAAASADVVRALRLPFAAIDLLAGSELVRVADAGSEPAGTTLLEEPLVHQGEVLGRLVVAPRAADERLGPADRRLLADLARQIGAAAQLVRLHADLQRSRERLVLAREEERRALRRTLHDDLGPAVAGLALRAETARRMLSGGTVDADVDERVAEELGVLRRDATEAAVGLRRLAYDLRPPALDELGLVGALRDAAERLAPLPVEVRSPEDLGELPAAVEVAAYRIAVEALGNAARHAAPPPGRGAAAASVAGRARRRGRGRRRRAARRLPRRGGPDRHARTGGRAGRRLRGRTPARGRRRDPGGSSPADRPRAMSEGTGPRRVRLVLVDDHPLFRDGLAALLATTDDLEVVGTGATGDAAVELADRLRPDVVVVDVRMPGLDGVEATRRITAATPSAGVLVLSMHDEDALVFAAVRAGARGYVVKDAEPDAVLAAVRAVARGEAVFGPALAGRLAEWFQRPAPEPFVELTPRERDVLDLLARGLGNATIAERLGISHKTVRNVVSSVLVKLQVSDRAAAATRARERGLGGS